MLQHPRLPERAAGREGDARTVRTHAGHPECRHVDTERTRRAAPLVQHPKARVRPVPAWAYLGSLEQQPPAVGPEARAGYRFVRGKSKDFVPQPGGIAYHHGAALLLSLHVHDRSIRSCLESAAPGGGHAEHRPFLAGDEIPALDDGFFPPHGRVQDRAAVIRPPPRAELRFMARRYREDGGYLRRTRVDDVEPVVATR